jgi:hypothetical protein
VAVIMKNLSILILILLFFPSCSSDKAAETKCIEPKIKCIYFEQGCNGDKCGYFHTVMLDHYNDNCFNDYDFIYIADKYLDSVKTNLPVKGITFVKPFNFQPVYDSRDIEPIRDNSIVDIYFMDDTMKNKVPEITSICIWINGERKQFEYMNVSSRKQRMGYYNSKVK